MTETPSEYVLDFGGLLKARAGWQKKLDELHAHEDEVLQPWTDKIASIRTELEKLRSRFMDDEERMLREIVALDQQLRNEWRENPKTQYVDGFVVRRRDVRVLDVKDEILLLDELTRLGKLAECVKKYDEKKVMALAEVGVLKPQAAQVAARLDISCVRDKGLDDNEEAPASHQTEQTSPQATGHAEETLK